PEVIRYFMTIPEAVQLVIQAGAFAKGGEIFILDMGDPVKIDDLAKDMIRLSGLEPNQDIEIKYTGLRPGEKLFEELLLSEEGLTATKNNRIFIARPTHIDKAAFAEELEQLKNILIEEREKDFVEIIRSIVPTFKTLTQEEKSISQ
ncbi:MAG TPA: polysaccharide biosynthesis protein, partial [Thermoanaerobacter sp.]|nr:polysaccharide biosynthesis protein [Thermoanaerobacter sp.]